MLSSHQDRSRSSMYRLSTEPRQQRVLRAIDRLARPDITALGTTRDGDYYVVAKCASAVAEMRVRRIVMSLDLLSEQVPTSTELYETEPPASGFAAGLDLPMRLVRRLPVDRLRKIL